MRNTFIIWVINELITYNTDTRQYYANSFRAVFMYKIASQK